MRKLSALCAAFAALGLVACGAEKPSDSGSASISVRSGAAHEFSGTVTLRVYSRADFTGSDLDIWNWSSDRVFDGNIVGATHVFDSLPVGNYTFCAINGSYGPACVKPVVVLKNRMAAVSLILQQAGNDGKVTIDSPFISGISLSDGAPYFGQAVTISATVTGDMPLTYNWSFTCADAESSFSAQGPTTVLQTTCRGTGEVKIDVSNGQIHSFVTFPLKYSPQGANVGVVLNNWPIITGFEVAQAQLKPNEHTSINLLATDDEGLSYAWTSTCGELDSATGTTAGAGSINGFTAPATTGDCTVTVEVTDGLGGKSTSSVVLHVGLGFLTASPFTYDCTNGCVLASTPGLSSYLDADGLHLTRVPDGAGHFYSAGAEIIGVAGMPFESASFETTGIVAVGTPRFNVSFADGSRCLVDNAVRNLNTYTFTNASLYQKCAGPEHGAMTRVVVIADGSNTDPAALAITLTNIKVNGIPVIQ